MTDKRPMLLLTGTSSWAAIHAEDCASTAPKKWWQWGSPCDCGAPDNFTDPHDEEELRRTLQKIFAPVE